MAYSKCLNSQTLIVRYANFTKMQNSYFLDIMTIGFFQNGKENKNSDFMKIFSYSVSNIFVELLVTHKKIYILKELPQLYLKM